MKQIFHLKSYLTFLSRNKAYTAINVFGLSVSLTFVILLVVFVRQEYSVDEQHSRLDRLGVVAVESQTEDFLESGGLSTGSNRSYGEPLKARVPELEETCGLIYSSRDWISLGNGEQLLTSVLYADSTFFRLFDYRLAQGDPATALATPEAAVISEQTARRVFGEQNPMGRHIVYDDSLNVTVTGVFTTLGNTQLKTPDMIVSMEQKVRQEPYIFHYNLRGFSELYLLARPGVSIRELEPKIQRELVQIDTLFASKRGFKERLMLLPLRGLYLTDSKTDVGRRGDLGVVRLFGFVALIVLLFSVMNYVNLTIAQSGYRAREMASRRLFGAQRLEIVLKLMVESVVLCLLSALIAVGLALVAAPYVGHLLNTTLLMNRLLLPESVLTILGTVLLIGLVAGAAPAVIQSRAKPIEVVRGTFRKTTRMVFSRVFIIVQNIITIGMIAAALTVFFQVRHLLSAPLGYDPKGVMMIPNYDVFEDSKKGGQTATLFRDKLRQLPCVELVGCAGNAPVFGGNPYHFEIGGKKVEAREFHGDENWFRLMGVEVLEDFHTGGDGPWVTRSLYAAAGLKDGSRVWYPLGDRDFRDPSKEGERETIRGIIADFHVSDITEQELSAQPKIVYTYKDVSGRIPATTNWLVKVRGNEREAYEQVARLYRETFHKELYLHDGAPYLEQKLASHFEEQTRLLHIISLFAGIAVLISLMGLIAMSTYFIQQRRKEIAIRKVYGSTSRQIWTKLVRVFLVYVVVSFVIAAPVVWRYMGDWLSQYSYRIPLWPCILAAGFISVLISLAAVFIQSWLAANENPIGHIKDNG